MPVPPDAILAVGAILLQSVVASLFARPLMGYVWVAAPCTIQVQVQFFLQDDIPAIQNSMVIIFFIFMGLSRGYQ